MQIAYEFRYVGPQPDGQTYLPTKQSAVAAAMINDAHDPATLPSCENALTSANTTARFEGGRGKVLLSHA